MNALIIGGTSGLGEKMTSCFKERGYNTFTISRAETGSYNHYVCDVGDLDRFKETLEKLKSRTSLDALVCVAGFAQPAKLETVDAKIIEEHFIRNTLYVDLAFEQFKDSLAQSENLMFITFGSQWSIKLGFNALLPYALAKHALRIFTHQKAIVYPSMKIFHYCVPITNTPARARIMEQLERLNKQTLLTHEPASPELVVRSLIHHLFESNTQSGTYVIDFNGSIKKYL